jgi:cytochrome c oxidase subunit 3
MSIFETLAQKPWLPSQEIKDNEHLGKSFSFESSRVALICFLCSITALFSLFFVAYIGRMAYGDWRILPEPNMLWLNTFILFLSSVFFQKAKNLSNDFVFKRSKSYLIIAGLFALLFIIGQISVWSTLTSSGYFVDSNPSFAFFYMLTGLHMIHLLGGLVVWAWSVFQIFKEDISYKKLKSTISSTAVYWHYLLVVWIILFCLLLAT